MPEISELEALRTRVAVLEAAAELHLKYAARERDDALDTLDWERDVTARLFRLFTPRDPSAAVVAALPALTEVLRLYFETRRNAAKAWQEQAQDAQDEPTGPCKPPRSVAVYTATLPPAYVGAVDASGWTPVTTSALAYAEARALFSARSVTWTGQFLLWEGSAFRLYTDADAQS